MYLSGDDDSDSYNTGPIGFWSPVSPSREIIHGFIKLRGRMTLLGRVDLREALAGD